MVLGLIRPEPKSTYTLVFKGSNGNTDQFRATADHPWFTGSHQWVNTQDLKVGDKIETATGDDMTVVSLELSGKVERTYNLEVQGLHTFLVGKDHLVVHNSKCMLAIEIHHMLPQALKARFAKVGLDIEQHKIALTFFEHRAAGSGVHAGETAESWNGVWKEFFDKVGNPTKQQILDQLAKMRTDSHAAFRVPSGTNVIGFLVDCEGNRPAPSRMGGDICCAVAFHGCCRAVQHYFYASFVALIRITCEAEKELAT